ncbi:apolipoprotein A-IV precursor [Silurus meridionalis]|nr:apolipoprotein A-IV precursor [Silurus meridionalis]
MKVFLLLVIVAFTGCQAKQPIDVIWVYWANAKHTAEETMKTIGEFKLVQEVNARFTEGANVAKTYTDMLREQVNPVVQDVITKINKEAEVLKLSLEQDLTTVRDKLEPYTGDIKAEIQEKVEELREAVAPYTELLDIEALKTTVLQKTEEIRGNMESLNERLISLYKSITKTE